MKFPSVQAAVAEARSTLDRFPLAILSALGATAAALRLIDHSNSDWLLRLLGACLLGFPLFTAARTAAERRGAGPGTRWAVDILLALGLAIVFAQSLAWTDTMAVLRFVQLLLATHLAAAVAPFLAGDELQGLWQYNRILLLRWILASIYAAALWAGLCIAVLALDKLLGVSLPEATYPRLFVVLSFAFHPWFFLAGVPRDLAALERLEEYPGGLKIFTQMVLMPLVAVYLVILTLYLGKVVATRTWPSGWIGFLVSSVSAVGVLALLLVHPLRTRQDSRWVNWYGRWFFAALLPSLGMLLLAVGKRIGQYGFTEPRYFLLVLALWLLVLALYYAVSASQNIKLIPVSLGLLTVATLAGPWGAYATSRRSQTRRLASILAEHRPAGRSTGGSIAVEDRREMTQILSYLEEAHGLPSMAAALAIPVDSLRRWNLPTGTEGSGSVARAAMRHLGIEPVEGGVRGAFMFSSNGDRSMDVAGFEIARPISAPALGWIGRGADSVQLVPDSSTGVGVGVVTVRRGDSTLATFDIGAAIGAALAAADTVIRRGRMKQDPIVVDGAGGGLRFRFVINHATGTRRAATAEVRTFYGFVLAAGFGPAP